MPKGHRKKGQPLTSKRNVEARRKQGRAVELRLKGWTLWQIADELGYKQPCGALRAIQTGMIALCPPEKVEELRQREVVKCEVIEREAWEQWRRSTENAVCVTTTTGIDGDDDEAESEPAKKVVKEEGQSGNPALLDKVLKAMERRAKLLGLDQPQLIDVTQGPRIIGQDRVTILENAAKRAKGQLDVAGS